MKPKPRTQAEIERALRPFVDIVQIQQAVSGQNPLPGDIIPTQAICIALSWALGYDNENFEDAVASAKEAVDELKTLAGVREEK